MLVVKQRECDGYKNNGCTNPFIGCSNLCPDCRSERKRAYDASYFEKKQNEKLVNELKVNLSKLPMTPGKQINSGIFGTV